MPEGGRSHVSEKGPWGNQGMGMDYSEAGTCNITVMVDSINGILS